MFLVSSKRSLEVSTDMKDYRSNFKKSDKEVLDFLSMISITSVFIFFSIYSITNDKPLLLLSLPIALYIVTNFLSKKSTNQEIIRNPEKFILDVKTLTALSIWIIIIIAAFYLT